MYDPEKEERGEEEGNDDNSNADTTAISLVHFSRPTDWGYIGDDWAEILF